MKSPIIASILLVLAAPAFAIEGALTPAGRTVTPAQWKDLDTIYHTFGTCGDSEREKVCDIAHKLMKKMEKQGFCFYKRLIVGKVGKRYTQEEWNQNVGGDPRTDPVPKNARHCDALHVPAP